MRFGFFAHPFRPKPCKTFGLVSFMLVTIYSLVYTEKKKFQQSTQFNYFSFSLRRFPGKRRVLYEVSRKFFSTFLSLSFALSCTYPFPSTLTEKTSDNYGARVVP